MNYLTTRPVWDGERWVNERYQLTAEEAAEVRQGAFERLQADLIETQAAFQDAQGALQEFVDATYLGKKVSFNKAGHWSGAYFVTEDLQSGTDWCPHEDPEQKLVQRFTGEIVAAFLMEESVYFRVRLLRGPQYAYNYWISVWLEDAEVEF